MGRGAETDLIGQSMTIRLAVDIGGTFVDAVSFDRESRRLSIEKSPATPAGPAEGVLQSVVKLKAELGQAEAFNHGTTLGINALLERKGAPTGLITNRGFRDLYEIGRTNLPRHSMYDIHYQRPPLLVPRRRRIGVPGRLNADGEIIEALDEKAVERAAELLIDEEGVQSIGICFLHSYQNPEPERRAADVIRSRYPNVSLSISSDITREYREYERTSTAVLDAYIKPIFQSYVNQLHDALRKESFQGGFYITRSGGGMLTWERAKQAPVHTILSGPAGGIIGAAHVAKVTGRPNLISVDMGGTSLDACIVIDGKPAVEYEASLEHLPVVIPVYDIRTIGAGGGSIAWIDGELLKVGPQSAGADPGPIAYGLGGSDPTVTDAALVLGYLDPDAFLGGEMVLDQAAALAGIRERVAVPLGMTETEASRGVFEVTLGRMAGAIREITVERGLDPREFSMLAYGGAGPMVIPLLGRLMRVAEVVVPQAPSVFSAWGMLMADVVYDFSQTYLAVLSGMNGATLERLFEKLEDEANSFLETESFTKSSRRCERSAEMRYLGQEHTVTVPANDLASPDELADRFQQQHLRRYGHNMEDPPQLVHLRVRAVGAIDKPELQHVNSSEGGDGRPAASRRAYCFASEGVVEFEVRRRDGLREGDEIAGPAIIQEPTTTIVIQSDQRARIDEYGQIIIGEGSTR